jgi:NSS family neurotransmitter:Na+ symporter
MTRVHGLLVGEDKMANNLELTRSQWTSPLSYTLVTIGAVVGLGNVIQFPYFVAQYGGLFVLFYIICELLISMPLMFAELMIGRAGRQNPVGSIGIVVLESGASPAWRKIGWLSVIVAFFTLAYYLVQAAFPLNYFWNALHALSIYGVDEPTAVAVQSATGEHFIPIEVCFISFLVLTMLVISRGINRGLEMISWVIVPAYFFILLSLAVYVSWSYGFFHSLQGLFDIHETQSVVTVLFAALGFALFKLNVGMGSMIVYGSYLPYNGSFARSTLWIVWFDIVISLLSYFIIYPLLSNSGLQTLNNYNVIYIFSAIPGSILVAALFFLAAIMAAWTCTIAMAETVAITLIERFSWSRARATWVLFCSVFLVGSFSAVANTEWMHVMIFDILPMAGIVKNSVGNVLAPISALLIALFAGWAVKRNISQRELNFNPCFYRVWRFLLLFAPILIVLIFLSAFTDAF